MSKKKDTHKRKEKNKCEEFYSENKDNKKKTT